jgi:hypothetical protein
MQTTSQNPVNNNDRNQTRKSTDGTEDKWRNFITTNSFSKICGICLESYKGGDTVCLSYNDDCEHVFHKKCIVSWLIHHEDCPNCRAPFFVSQE